ncbi:hypothetical protein TRVA0_006S04016 [Trichomonascus vanleenenianus]|uniref:uncharacterized protein n=1 Tax=Trichomonascus vanleenenianus TaxID=2268995 RepID=UPI003EC956B3
MAFSQQHPLLRPVRPATTTETSETTSLGLIPNESRDSLYPSSSRQSSSDLVRAATAQEQEWIVFSPRVSDITSLPSTQSESSAAESDDEGLSGLATPLALPTHNGSGSFDMHSRVNAWRLDQSQLVLQELQRLEMRYARRRARMASTPATPDSVVASWGIEPRSTSSSMVALSSLSKHNSNNGVWSYLRKRIVVDFMGIDDTVMELMLGMRYIDPIKSDNSIAPHYRKSLEHGPKNWESTFITRMFSELHLPRARDLMLFRYLQYFYKNLHESPQPSASSSTATLTPSSEYGTLMPVS